MPGYRLTRQLTREEAAYIAGIVDGEGTIALSHRHRNDNRQLVISIASTERGLLEHIQRTVGAGRITSKRTTSTRHSPSATYAIDNRQALTLLEQIASYLRTYKAKRAELILRDYVRLTPRNGKYSAALRLDRNRFIEAFLQLRPSAIGPPAQPHAPPKLNTMLRRTANRGVQKPQSQTVADHINYKCL